MLYTFHTRDTMLLKYLPNINSDTQTQNGHVYNFTKFSPTIFAFFQPGRGTGCYEDLPTINSYQTQVYHDLLLFPSVIHINFLCMTEKNRKTLRKRKPNLQENHCNFLFSPIIKLFFFFPSTSTFGVYKFEGTDLRLGKG